MSTHHTYADTQGAGQFDGWVSPPTEYGLYLACPPAGGLGYIEVDGASDNPTKFLVDEIPAAVRPETVARHLSTLMFALQPDHLGWPTVRDLKPGTVIKSKRFGLSVVDETGKRHLGWLRPEPPVALSVVAPNADGLRVIEHGLIVSAGKDIGSAAEIFGGRLSRMQAGHVCGAHEGREADDWRALSLDGKDVAELRVKDGKTAIYVDGVNRANWR